MCSQPDILPIRFSPGYTGYQDLYLLESDFILRNYQCQIPGSANTRPCRPPTTLVKCILGDSDINIDTNTDINTDINTDMGT